MRILLTGANGFLGRYVLDELNRNTVDLSNAKPSPEGEGWVRGNQNKEKSLFEFPHPILLPKGEGAHTIKSTVLKPSRQNIKTIILGRRPVPDNTISDFIEADLLNSPDFAALVKASRATHLLHLAWYAEHGKYWTSPLNLRWVDATTRLVEAFCEAGGQQVVVAGSCAEYDWSHGYCREDSTPLTPTTLYGAAKDATRRLIMTMCAQYQVPCAWSRVFLPFGAGESRQRLIPSLIEVFQAKRPAFGVNALAYRDFLHASDVANGFLALLQNGASGAYNISSGQPVPLEHIVRELARLLDADPQPVLALSAEHPEASALLVGANNKLKTLGWQPAFSLAQGLERTVREALP